MEALSSFSSVVWGRSARVPLFSLLWGGRMQLKKKCKFAIQPRRHYVAALSSGIASAGVSESLAQLHLELAHHLVALGLPLQSDAAESSVWSAVAAASLACWYISAAPGSIGGLLDYVSTPMLSLSHKSFSAQEVEVGRQIGQGSFGIVYEGYIGRGSRKGSQSKEIRVILKKMKPGIRAAAEMHATEEYMNRRVQRTAPSACAEYLGRTLVSRQEAHGRLTEGLWLIWMFEGGRTLDYYLKQRNFPDNVAEYILGSKKMKEQTSTKAGTAEQSNAVIRKIMFQILSNLRDLHRTGLVHRDVKPLNLILAEDEGTFKLIDLGACVDVRSGYNFVPDETIIDPTYAAPEHHIMPTSTPELPPDPLCSLISPVVWALNTPDRFDLYSAGLIMLQLAVKPLRQDMNLVRNSLTAYETVGPRRHSFNTELKRVGYDLEKWRKRCRFSDEDFELLDADGGAGWELVKSMLQPRHDKELIIWPSIGSSRPSAEAALRHRFFNRSFIKLPSLITSFRLPSFNFNGQVSGSARPPVVAAFKRPASEEVGVSKSPAVKSVITSKLKPVQLQLEFDNSQILRVLSALTQPALAVGASWLVFSGLRSTAQATYALGQSITQSVGISGTAFIAFFLIIKPWLETQGDKVIKYGGHVSGNRSLKLDCNARAETLMTTLTRHSPPNRQSQTGLADAVKEMELQLASLEASIFLEGESAKQQDQRIRQLEKLLIRNPRIDFLQQERVEIKTQKTSVGRETPSNIRFENPQSTFSSSSHLK